MKWWISSGLLVLSAGLSAFSTAIQPDVSTSPVLAIVLANGRLLPLATFSADKWIELPWPQHESSDAQDSPAVPLRVSEIPHEWFAPLPALPTTWRLRVISGDQRVVHSGAPTRWEIATFDSVGLSTDYQSADTDSDAGVAVSGAVEVLPIRRYNSHSPEWRQLAREIAPDLLGAERRDMSRSHRNRRLPTVDALVNQLSNARDLDLWRVTSREGNYLYFDGRRHIERKDRCVLDVYLRGLLRRQGSQLKRLWIRALDGRCDDPSEVMEVVGGVRIGERVWLVVKYSGDDWQQYELLDPTDPNSEFGGLFPTQPEGGSRQPEAGSSDLHQRRQALPW